MHQDYLLRGCHVLSVQCIKHQHPIDYHLKKEARNELLGGKGKEEAESKRREVGRTMGIVDFLIRIMIAFFNFWRLRLDSGMSKAKPRQRFCCQLNLNYKCIYSIVYSITSRYHGLLSQWPTRNPAMTESWRADNISESLDFISVYFSFFSSFLL